MDISRERRGEIIAALRKGTVPQRGLDFLAVGLARFESSIGQEMANVAQGGAVFKAVRGDYGCGKTFFARWVQENAKQKGFATAEVQISETETPLHRLETVYRRAMEQLSTADCFLGAFRSIIDGWFYGLEEDVLAEGTIDPSDDVALARRADELLEQRLVEITRSTPQFAAALRTYRAAQRQNDHATAEGLAGWLAGQPHVAASIKRMTAFERLHPALQHHIVNSLGWSELREVQSLSIDAFLTGANLVILAPTAGGKTESAFFPVISQMLTEGWQGLSVLYVSPIRALLNNQEQRLQKYFSLVGRRAACWHGDTTQGARRRILADWPDCLLTTPESLEAILVSTKIDHREFFKNVRAIVIDELHAFAGDDRGWHLLSVFSRIHRLAGRDLQRIGLSATVGNPAEMLVWLSSGSERPKQVVSPVPVARQAPDVQLDYVGSLQNAAKVISLLHQGEKRLVFCDSRSRVEQLALLLREREIDTFVSHSSLGLEERRAAEEAFAQKQNCVIVATSSLELGLDVGDLDRVIQIDAPATVSSFLQRMGRTGRRAGTRSNCLFLATSDEGLLRAAALLDLWSRGFVEPVNAPPKPFHILAQQLMALVLQERGVGRRTFVEWLSDVPAFAAMPGEQIETLVEHLIRSGTLFEDAGILSFGQEGEAEYGRKNFLEILSVFTSPPLFRVLSGQKELGNVHESTFYKKQEGPTILLLAGRNWKTNHLDWKRRIAYVEPTDEKGRSRWIGEGQFLGFRVCQAIRRVLAAESTEPYWSQRATAQIAEIRLEYPWASHDRTTLVLQANGEVQWWTFAGGLANSIVMNHLVGDSQGKTDNLCLRFSSTIKLADVETLIASRILDEITPVPSQEAIDNLKFGECLPPPIAAEVFSARFNDPEAIANIRREPMRVVVAGQ